MNLLVAGAFYLLVLTVIGVAAKRRSSTSPEEYFLAGRGLGTLVLFMALFGTNCTSFVLVGVPGKAWEAGIGVFGLNASIVALGVPLTFWAIGVPASRMARRLGALTPAELYRRRLDSTAVGFLLFLFFTLYTVPYMVQGVKGAGLVLAQATDGAVPAWGAGLGVVAVVWLYTSLGGMRATAWTNVFQGALFLGFMVAAFFLMARSLGGLDAATERVREVAPDHLRIVRQGLFEPRKWASWGLVISMTVIGFPHMLARLMAASGTRSLRAVCRLYPLALALLWVPAVMIGVWGRGAFPDLERGDAVFQAMADAHLPDALGPLALLAVFAAVMSTFDAQLLTLSSMLVRDVLDVSRPERGGGGDVRASRLFTLALAALVYGLSLTWGQSVFEISAYAFAGYTTLVPCLFLGVRWRRFNATGAVASLLVGNGVLLAATAGTWFPLFGFLPVFWAFLAAVVAGVAGSLFGAPTARARLEEAFSSPRGSS